MESRRHSGVLAHLVSLPGADTQGALGSDSHRFVEFLAAAGFSVWQMLPINPVGTHQSPYQSCCADAGDARFISLDPNVLGFDPRAPGTTDVELVDDLLILKEAFDRDGSPAQHDAFKSFVKTESSWLLDYARFRVLKHRFDDRPWMEWPIEHRDRSVSALRALDTECAESLEAYQFQQYLFFEQWRELRDFATAKGIRLFGDLAMFVAHDSVEVWAHRRYFQLTDDGQLGAIAGVPPDYFSSDGQLWGTPLYNWETLEHERFDWWIARIKRQLRLFDLVRLDHFRGFLGVWAVPPGDETAARGQWQTVPGGAFFRRLLRVCKSLPLVAEDLGSITPDVLELRDRMRLPGIKVLQFAFDSDAANPYLPHNHTELSIVCTGTHDNNTTVGWFAELDENRRKGIMEYCGYPQEAMPWPLIRAALASVSRLSVIPLQDWLELGSEHRLNKPGTVEGNWRWRFEWDWLEPSLVDRMRYLNTLYGRS